MDSPLSSFSRVIRVALISTIIFIKRSKFYVSKEIKNRVSIKEGFPDRKQGCVATSVVVARWNTGEDRQRTSVLLVD